MKSATGWNEVSYALVRKIPNARLQLLFNLALFTCDALSLWLTTLLAGVLKRGKDAALPDNYRTRLSCG